MEGLPGVKSEVVRQIEDKVGRQEKMLAKEVKKFCDERGEEVMGVAREKVVGGLTTKEGKGMVEAGVAA